MSLVERAEVTKVSTPCQHALCFLPADQDASVQLSLLPRVSSVITNSISPKEKTQ